MALSAFGLLKRRAVFGIMVSWVIDLSCLVVARPSLSMLVLLLLIISSAGVWM